MGRASDAELHTIEPLWCFAGSSPLLEPPNSAGSYPQAAISWPPVVFF